MADINRILAAAAETVWLIDEPKMIQIANMLALRAENRAGDEMYETQPEPVYAAASIDGRRGPVHVLNLEGTIIPKSGMMSRFSGGASLDRFAAAFDQAAADATAQAIVLNIDSPGGVVDMVQETAEKVYRARRPGRPIIAVANTLAASAAYWIASSADEVVVSPSGHVGSVGVYGEHRDMSAALEKAGIKRTLIRAGARKAEGAIGPLDDAALAHRQASADYVYDKFTRAVSRNRGIDLKVIQADPVKTKAHFGAGRAYPASDALSLGMADRIEAFEETLKRVARGRRTPATARARIMVS